MRGRSVGVFSIVVNAHTDKTPIFYCTGEMKQ